MRRGLGFGSLTACKWKLSFVFTRGPAVSLSKLFFVICVQEGLQEGVQEGVQEGPRGWEITARCVEASLVLWYQVQEEEQEDDVQASMCLRMSHVAYVSCDCAPMNLALPFFIITEEPQIAD